MVRTFSFAFLVFGLYHSQFVAADEPIAIPRATTDQVHQTVDRATAYLQAESAAWLDSRKCAACHHAGMPLWALAAVG